MTEKRFRAKLHHLNPNQITAIVDNKNNNELTVFREVLDMLNSLNEKNEQLEQQIKELNLKMTRDLNKGLRE